MLPELILPKIVSEFLWLFYKWSKFFKFYSLKKLTRDRIGLYGASGHGVSNN